MRNNRWAESAAMEAVGKLKTRTAAGCLISVCIAAVCTAVVSGGCDAASDTVEISAVQLQSSEESEESFVFPPAVSLLPSRWDPVEHGRKTTVRSQGSYGTCWALASAAAMESSLLPETQIEFSADHMALNNRFDTALSDGGDYVMIMAYLSGWQGPVIEAEDPYGDGISPDDLEPAVHVQEIRMLPENNREKVKEAVSLYGAVQTSLYMSRAETAEDQDYYQSSNAAYYYPEEKVQNHDIIILGWDDHYSRFLFKQTPPIDGAFICQNSWGEDFGEDGLFYVSYADANIARTGLIYSRIEDTDNYQHLYQTDDCGWQGQQGYADETCWFANVYTAGEMENSVYEPETPESGSAAGAADDGTANGDPESQAADEKTEASEYLAAYGFYAAGADTSYELYLVHDFENTDSFSSLTYLQSGTLEDPGYYTIDLETPIPLKQGERFAAAVKITTPGAGHPVAVEYRSGPYTQNIITEGKEGYLSQNGNFWENTEQKFGSNVCLKIYTIQK